MSIKVCTWNSQGYKFGDGTISTLLSMHNIDILCLQECGILSNISFTPFNNIKYGLWSLNRKTAYSVLYYEWGASSNGSRCNMAILINNTIKIQHAFCMKPVTTTLTADCEEEETEAETGEGHLRSGLRGMLHTLIEKDSNKYRIANVHLPSGKPKFARKIGYTFLSMPFMQEEGVIMVGDFNTTPDTWELGSFHNCIVAKNAYSYPSRDKNLDYMITTIFPSSINANVISAPNSDHLPVLFDIP